MSRVEVLISAMHQNDFSIFQRTQIKTDALMINQCDEVGELEKNTEYGFQRIISTTERGLSRSRNLAIQNAKSEICLLCDDDEMFYKGYARKIENAYDRHPDADLICFQIKREGKKYPGKEYRVNYLKSLRISSWQLSMKVDSILRAGIRFDTDFGSGTPLGSGEENIFMFDCLKAGLKIYYVPVCIGKVEQKQSNWFHGFTDQYFFNRGRIIRRMMGTGIGTFYGLYFIITKFPRYKNQVPFRIAALEMFKGLHFEW